VQLRPIASTLRYNATGVVIIVLQIALTVAILCNALSIIQQQRLRMARPSGVDEAEIFTLRNRWATSGTDGDFESLTRADLLVLRGLAGVIDAAAMNSFPLRGYGLTWNVRLRPRQRLPSASSVAVYAGGEQALNALGVRLVAGRWFRPDEIAPFSVSDIGGVSPAEVVITASLARALFPDVGTDAAAVGRVVYLNANASTDVAAQTPTRVIGIVQQAQTPWAAVDGTSLPDRSSMFWPYQYVAPTLAYVVRTRPGRRDAVMRAAEQALFAADPNRIIDEAYTFRTTRALMYRSDRALSVTLAAVSVLLLAVTACGVVGTTAYWVAQRRRQIGIRRALGARRGDILGYFHLENLLIASGGAGLGIALGVALNLAIAAMAPVARMSGAFLGGAALIVLALSQAAVLWPALRAASVPPAEATRSV